MEGGVFRDEPVRSELKEHFVEARLHTDKAGPHLEQVRALQKSMVGSLALPVYIVVDPAAPRTQLGSKKGNWSGEKFVAFLQKARGK